MSTRKTRDKWAMKSWVRVLAPKAFGFADLGSIPANEPEKTIGRTVEVSFYDITKDPSQLHIKLKFQIVKVEGTTAYTQLKLMELTRDYIRSLVRRGTSRIDAIIDVQTKDGVKLRVMGMAVTITRVKTSQRKAIRKIMFQLIEEKASQLDFDTFIQQAVLGNIASEIEVNARKIYPLKKAEIRKIKVLTNTFEIPLTKPESLQVKA
ncbi:MAG: 30S ribosomal protein S3ae [Infirmifilum sp.]|uniref:Small ribosomal subunit protein eS1 n=1 Tax=Infirmifilum uzonense TaxID=1550241 RepID=A0A0F7CL69_9CREN|nr:30S ribosomal protein S3ae [Infirmifilum uzonense]AKG38891.1 30S ribosomal protein S3Ae [Infirmifilum uzonense]